MLLRKFRFEYSLLPFLLSSCSWEKRPTKAFKELFKRVKETCNVRHDSRTPEVRSCQVVRFLRLLLQASVPPPKACHRPCFFCLWSRSCFNRRELRHEIRRRWLQSVRLLHQSLQQSLHHPSTCLSTTLEDGPQTSPGP